MYYNMLIYRGLQKWSYKEAAKILLGVVFFIPWRTGVGLGKNWLLIFKLGFLLGLVFFVALENWELSKFTGKKLGIV